MNPLSSEMIQSLCERFVSIECHCTVFYHCVCSTIYFIRKFDEWYEYIYLPLRYGTWKLCIARSDQSAEYWSRRVFADLIWNSLPHKKEDLNTDERLLTNKSVNKRDRFRSHQREIIDINLSQNSFLECLVLLSVRMRPIQLNCYPDILSACRL